MNPSPGRPKNSKGGDYRGIWRSLTGTGQAHHPHQPPPRDRRNGADTNQGGSSTGHRSVVRPTKSCTIATSRPPVAQLDRALPSGGRGQRFESSRAGHTHKGTRDSGFFCGYGPPEGRGEPLRFDKSAGLPIWTPATPAPRRGERQGWRESILSGAPPSALEPATTCFLWVWPARGPRRTSQVRQIGRTADLDAGNAGAP